MVLLRMQAKIFKDLPITERMKKLEGEMGELRASMAEQQADMHRRFDDHLNALRTKLGLMPTVDI